MFYLVCQLGHVALQCFCFCIISMISRFTKVLPISYNMQQCLGLLSRMKSKFYCVVCLGLYVFFIFVGRGGSLVYSSPFVRGDVGSNLPRRDLGKSFTRSCLWRFGVKL